MRTNTKKEELAKAIYDLKFKQSEDWYVLKQQMHETYESLKPVNIIKSTIQEVSSSTEIKQTLLHNAMGIATGYLSKWAMIGSTTNPIKKVLGTVLQFAISNIVAKHSETIISKGEELFYHLIEPKKVEVEEEYPIY